VINVGPTRALKTISAGLSAAKAGSTILVDNGTYNENVAINKAVTLQAASGATPIIDAGKKYPAIWVYVNNVVVNGFTIRNGGPLYAGIYVSGSGATITNNKISGCGRGIFLTTGTGSTVRGNTVSGATTCGLEVRGSGNNKLQDNVVTSSATAIRLYNTKGNTITGNSLSGNTYDLKIEGSSSGNTLYLNDFRDSITVAGSNTFSSPTALSYTYNGKPFTGNLGNYWSAYKGADANGNGVGDTVYSKSGYKDKYPLMGPHTNYRTG
jgi:parallel beta-helix repeat protein